MSNDDEQLNTTVARALDALDQLDSFEAVSRLVALGDPTKVIQGFNLAVRELFAQRKLPQMLWIGRAGVEYALHEARRLIESKSGRERLSAARKLAYNVSSNLWPGWGDEAVQPTLSDLQTALDLARVHRRIVIEEELGPEFVGNARWLVGAQRLAVGQEQAAHYEFEAARTAFTEAKKPASQWMAEGFQSLSLQLMGTMATEGQRRFEAAILELKQLGDEGDFFADQLQTAKRVFLAR